jgi:hypothetical protein
VCLLEQHLYFRQIFQFQKCAIITTFTHVLCSHKSHGYRIHQACWWMIVDLSPLLRVDISHLQLLDLAAPTAFLLCLSFAQTSDTLLFYMHMNLQSWICWQVAWAFFQDQDLYIVNLANRLVLHAVRGQSPSSIGGMNFFGVYYTSKYILTCWYCVWVSVSHAIININKFLINNIHYCCYYFIVVYAIWV